jgi:hypothetical protein
LEKYVKYRNLPGTGTSVSNLALGTMGFGTETEEADAFAILDRFIDANGNLVDTRTSTAAASPRRSSAAGLRAGLPTSPTGSS